MHKAGHEHDNSVACRGFTLTEILLVVAIIALLGGLSGGIYSGTYKRLLVEKAAREFMLMARYARIAAIEQQRPYVLEIDEASRGFALTTVRWNMSSGQTEKIIIRDLYCRPVEFGGDVKFESVKIAMPTTAVTSDADQGGYRIRFLPNGTAEAAVVQLGDGKTHYTVGVLAATGQASLYAGQADQVRTASIDLDAQ